MSKLIVHIDYDQDAESPADCDGWQPYSFSRKHGNYRDPEALGLVDSWGEGPPNPELQAKLDSGLAFALSYFEHGNCIWSLKGTGPQCRWDNVQFAGILIWDADDADWFKSYEEREADAKRFLESFTSWCNGEAYGFRVQEVSDCHACGQEEEGEEIASCYGYLHVESMFQDIAMEVGDRPVEFRGDSKYLADYHWPMKAVKA